MAPQPRLKEIWRAGIFEVSDEVHKHWNIILMRVRQTKNRDSQAVEENNREEGTRCDVCMYVSVWCHVAKMSGKCGCISGGVITTCSKVLRGNNSSFVTMFMRGREREREFLAGLIIIQPLSNPGLPLSTYNMAAYPLSRLQTERNLQRRRGRSEGA